MALKLDWIIERVASEQYRWSRHGDREHPYQQGDELLIVEEVPCLRCDDCGEEYFDVSTLKKIEADHLALATHCKRPARTLEVAVETFSAL
jgi:YgiT-type zinc finger domain-containing protein